MRSDENMTAMSAPQTAAADREDGGMQRTYGKFKTLEALIGAYDSLEAEFTRRSQRLKELEREASARAKTDSEGRAVSEQTLGGRESAEDFFERYPRAKAFFQSGAATELGDEQCSEDKERVYIKLLENELSRQQNDLSDKNFLLEKVKGDPAIEREIVKIYLKSLANSKPKAAFGGGNALLAPPHRPKDMTEASAMTEKFLNKKGEIKW